MSGQYALYKNKSAARFSLIEPRFKVFTDKSGRERRAVESEGAILVELADGVGKDANGNNSYNWEQKVTFALGIADLATLMENPWAALTHKHEKAGVVNTKVLSFQKMEARREGEAPKVWLGYRAKIEGEADERKVGAALTQGEHRVLLELLKNSIPVILGWSCGRS